MINDRLNMPDHYIGTTNGFLAQWLFEDMQERKKGTFAWDFVRYLFEMEDVDENEYMKQFKELFNTAFLSEESCKEWIDTKIIPLVKNIDYSITCLVNENQWKFKLFRPSKFRDYHNHQNVYVPTLIMEDSSGLMAAFATSAAFDAYDSYEDLVKIENFSGIIKGDKAITGEALYKSLLEKYKKSTKERIKVSSTKDSDGKIVKYKFNIPEIDRINREHFNELKKIKNNNVFRLPKSYDDYDGLQYPQPTVIAAIKGSDYKELFRILGTTDGKGVSTIHPENSPFPASEIYRRGENGEKDVLLSPKTVLKHIEDNKMYWLELEGWHRYSVPLIPDGHYKKRWQSQFYIVNPDKTFVEAKEWMVEKIQKLTYKDKWLYHLAYGDSNLKYYTDKKGKSLDWWLKTYKELDKRSYDLTWSISAKDWNTKKLIMK